MKAVVAAFNQEKALVGAFSVITNLRIDLFEALTIKHGVKQFKWVHFYISLVAGDATLVFEIELFEFHGEDVTKDTDLGVVKRVKVNGEGWDMPNDGAQVEVQLKGSVEGEQFEDRTVSFEMGEGGEIGVPRGVVDLGSEGHFGRLEGVLRGKHQVYQKGSLQTQ